MTNAVHSARRYGGWRRWPIVLLLTLGLLQALIHCADDGFALGGGSPASVTASNGFGAAPAVPEQQLPAHSGHCLSHVTVHPDAAGVPGGIPQSPAPAFCPDQSRPALAGWAPFKPPRA